MISVSVGKRTVHALAFSPDGRWLAAGAEGEVLLLDAQSGRVVWRKHPNGGRRPRNAPEAGVGWNRQGGLLAITPGGASFRWNDPESGAVSDARRGANVHLERERDGLIPPFVQVSAEWEPHVPFPQLYRTVLLDWEGGCCIRVEDPRPFGPGWWDADNRVAYFGGWAAGVVAVDWPHDTPAPPRCGPIPSRLANTNALEVAAAPLVPVRRVPGLPFLLWPVAVGRRGLVVCADNGNLVTTWRPGTVDAPVFEVDIETVRAGAVSPDGTMAAVGGNGGIVVWDLDG